MTETIRVIWVAAPYKLHLYQSISKYFPQNLHLKIVSAVLGYNGKIPLLSRLWRYRHGISFLPSRDLFRELANFKPDIVFTDYPAYPSWYAKLYAYMRGRRTPLIAWLLGDYWTEYYAYMRELRPQDRWVGPAYLFTWVSGINQADRLLTVCKWLQKRALERLPRKRMSVQYQGVDPEPWLSRDGCYDFNHPAVGILQVNNIQPKVMGLLQFAKVIERMPDVNFYVAGGGPYTPLVRKAFCGLRNVRSVGTLAYPDGVRKFYDSCDVYVLASGLDCCPTTLLEASLSSLPVVASRVGGIPELIREGKTGWTIPNDRVNDWIARIRVILDDKRLASEVGTRAKQHVLANFTWQRQAQSLARTFREELIT
jgi:glycosyltransferase involved in cell wall biosynthesis